MFNVDQAVNTPKGKAYVLEVSDNIAYVEMTNGVEMDFPIADIQDWDEFKAEQTKPVVLQGDLDPIGKPTLMQRLRLGEVMLDAVFAGDPKGRKEFTDLAGELLLAKVKRTIAKHEEKNDA